MATDLVGQQPHQAVGSHQERRWQPLAANRRPDLFEKHPPAPPHRAQQYNRHQAVQEQHDSRNVIGQEEMVGRHDSRRGQNGRLQQRRQVGKRDVKPPSLVMARGVEHRQLDRHDPRQRHQQRTHPFLGYVKIEPQRKRQPIDRGEHHQVRDRQQPRPRLDRQSPGQGKHAAAGTAPSSAHNVPVAAAARGGIALRLLPVGSIMGW